MLTQTSLMPVRPNLMRPECGVVVVSEWDAGTPERQSAASEAFANAWTAGEWPAGLLNCNFLKGNDGRSIAVYGQWTSEALYYAAIESHIRPRLAQVDLAVPGIDRKPPGFYRLQRSRIRDTTVYPGCIVLITFEFENPDQDRLKRFVGTVFRAVDAMLEQPVGALGGHFHLSTDGLRVLNYAEWVQAEDHRRAVEESGAGRIGICPGREEVHHFPGLKSSRFQRYTPGAMLASPEGSRA